MFTTEYIGVEVTHAHTHTGYINVYIIRVKTISEYSDFYIKVKVGERSNACSIHCTRVTQVTGTLWSASLHVTVCDHVAPPVPDR